ncbi:efflux RND transporter periplasmic adaptor subunit [Hydrogenophaga sp. 5NK40-0174]|uniref:efflux RND transporter periplasmic adaptor subunit n=1 Tax=Hydrogenophaga sp. 5NK40-0174 TaxID=3127649 RepID=UPI003108B218
MPANHTIATPVSIRRHPIFRSAAILSLAIALVACEDHGQAPAAPKATEVGVVTLQTQALSITRELSGRTVAAESADIRPQVSGIIEKRLFTEGAEVKAGEALYQIDAASYRTALDSANAAVAKAEASLTSARLNAERQARLLAADAVSRQDSEDAQANLLLAQAELKSAKASAASARLDLQRTRIASPISGRVDTSNVTAGALVTANQTTALTTVQQTDPMWVNITQSSAELLRLRQQVAKGELEATQGDAVTVQVRLEDGSSYAHEGHLQVAGVLVDQSTGAVTLRAEVPNPEGMLMPGMYVRVNLTQAKAPNAILAPQAGIQRDAGGKASALVIGNEDKVEKRAVEVAEAHGTAWRVTSGLKAGDRLIVEGTGKVRPGQIVSAVPAGQAGGDSVNGTTSPSAAAEPGTQQAAARVASNR